MLWSDGDAPVPVAGAAALVVRTAGGTMVATDALLAHVPILELLAEQLGADAARAFQLAAETTAGSRELLHRAAMSVQRAADRARALAVHTRAAHENYTWAEATALDLVRAASDRYATILGHAARLALPGWLMSGPSREWLAARGVGPNAIDPAKLQAWILENPQVYTNPEVVELVSRIVSGADDAALGALGVSPLLVAVLGRHGFGVLGVETSARTLIAGAAVSGAGVLRETPVTVTRGSTAEPVAAAASSSARFERVPRDEHVRIERVEAPGEPDRFVVYIAPTKTFEMGESTEPWDLTSNIAAIAGMPSGAMRATELAMTDAGITARSPVMFVGYSQGALVAERLAASGEWNAQLVETYGGPRSGATLDPAISGVSVRHTDDLVTALGGPHETSDRVEVERQAFPDAARVPKVDPLPAHQRSSYAATAELLGAAQSPQLRAELDAAAAFAGAGAGAGAGVTVTATPYAAERVIPARPANAR